MIFGGKLDICPVAGRDAWLAAGTDSWELALSLTGGLIGDNEEKPLADADERAAQRMPWGSADPCRSSEGGKGKGRGVGGGAGGSPIGGPGAASKSLAEWAVVRSGDAGGDLALRGMALHGSVESLGGEAL